MPSSTFRDSVLQVLSTEAKADRWSVEKHELVERVASLRRAEAERLPSNHRDITGKVLLRQEDAGRLETENKGGVVVIRFTESGARFYRRWVKPARGSISGPWPAKREVLERYRAHAELLLPVRGALMKPGDMDPRLWDAEKIPVVIQEHMDAMNNLEEQIAQLEENMEHTHTRLSSAERRLKAFGYCVDENGDVVKAE